MSNRDYYNVLVPALCLFFVLPTNSADIGLYFVRSPEPIVAPPGDEVIFECSLNVASESVKWKHGTHYLPREHQSIVSSSNVDLKLKVIDDEQAGDYQCIALLGGSALASVPAKLTLAELKPFPPAPPQHYTVTPGNTVAIECPAPVSFPPAVIQYFKNEVMLPASVYTLVTTGTLILSNVTSKDNGVYSCSASNDITLQTVFSNLKTTLNVAPSSEKYSPRFLSPPQSVYVAQKGTNVSMECSGVGNPPPQVIWRRGPVMGALPKDRVDLIPGALKLISVRASDYGEYICELNNGITPPAIHKVILQVQEQPEIRRGPANSQVNEGEDAEFECDVDGSPYPTVSWLLNGEPLDNGSHTHIIGNKLVITQVEKRHAGMLQCLATNPVGAVFGAATLLVLPKQITAQFSNGESHLEQIDPDFEESSEGGGSYIPSLPIPGRVHPKKEHKRKGKGGRQKDKKHRGSAVMIPPTRPNITRLTDTSVMVRWNVPDNDGLSIQFFKVQFKDLSGPGRNRESSSRWQTCSKDIEPFVRSYEVDQLETDHIYRFRIAAVYSNEDNKLGQNSARFHLLRGPQNRSPVYTPSLTLARGISPSAIEIQWEYLNSVLVPVDGFYVYYRATSSAGEYVKATVEGEKKRIFKIAHLLPDTAYDIKLQAFTVKAASDFSTILTAKTLKEINVTTVAPSVTNKYDKEPPDNRELYLIAGAVAGGVALTILLLTALCVCRHRSSEETDSDENRECDKVVGRGEPCLTVQQLDPVTGNGYVVHNGKVNGFIPRAINITNNPLAESQQDKNVMEMSYMSSQNNNCSAEGSSAGEEGASWRGRAGENYV
uniref:Interference hedgehog n=1 Tax=Clastoptera arizonana TaxID=38151 RepID=A0A1B6CKP4_9HEMI